MLITFKQFLHEAHDAKNFPKVDRDWKVYSSLPKEKLAKVAKKYKLPRVGTKGKILRTILSKLNGNSEVRGYYNKVTHVDFTKIKARNKAKSSLDKGTSYSKDLKELALLDKVSKKTKPIMKKIGRITGISQNNFADTINKHIGRTLNSRQHHLQRVATSLIHKQHHVKHLHGNEYHPSLMKASKKLHKGNVEGAHKELKDGLGVDDEHLTKDNINRATFHAKHVDHYNKRLLTLKKRANQGGVKI